MGSASWTEGARDRAQRGHLTSGSRGGRQVCRGPSRQEEGDNSRDTRIWVVGMVRRMTNLGQFAEEGVCFGVCAGLRVRWHREFTLQGLRGRSVLRAPGC